MWLKFVGVHMGVSTRLGLSVADVNFVNVSVSVGVGVRKFMGVIAGTSISVGVSADVNKSAELRVVGRRSLVVGCVVAQPDIT